MVTPAKTRMTAAEFWAFIETTERRYELINGEAIEMGTPIPNHQRVVVAATLVLTQIAKIQGGEVFVAPLEVYLDEDNIPQPDVMWIAPDSQCRIGEKRLEGPPDLIVEVFSPSTRQHDRVTKFRLYEKYGVREYWMVDPTAQYVEVWNWAGGRFAFQGVYVPGETFNSPVLNGQAVDAKALFGG